MKKTQNRETLPAPDIAPAPPGKGSRARPSARTRDKRPAAERGRVQHTDPAASTAGEVGPPAEAPDSHATRVVARIDVGFGNQLYIRGEGGGLAWDRGLPMECAGPSEWRWRTDAARAPLIFKVLLNDDRWSQGENFTAMPGRQTEIEPVLV